jgi:hypothetical protein
LLRGNWTNINFHFVKWEFVELECEDDKHLNSYIKSRPSKDLDLSTNPNNLIIMEGQNGAILIIVLKMATNIIKVFLQISMHDTL